MRIATLIMAATVLDWLGVPFPDSSFLLCVVCGGAILATIQDIREALVGSGGS
jgi:hypothetical protein